MIDAHAHILNTDYGNVDLYLEKLNEAGIEQAVVVPGGMVDVRRMTDYITGAREPETVIPDNQYVKECLQNNNSMLDAYVCIDPHGSNAAEQLEKAGRDGFKGLKFSPITHQFSFSSRAVNNLVYRCEGMGFPVYSHVLFNPGASTPQFVELAKRFPRVNFILGHMGFGPADQEGLEAARTLPNFYLETSTGSYLHIREAVNKAGADKIIYGSEFPLSHPKVELEKILLLDISDDKKEKILGRNIERLLSAKNIASQRQDRLYKDSSRLKTSRHTYGNRR